MKNVAKHKRLERIAVSRDAFIWLEQLSRKQRGCKPLNQEQIERVCDRKKKTPEGKIILDDESLGGGDGTYYGKWTNWDCADLKRMLKDNGFQWDDLDPIEFDCIDVYI